MRISKNLLAAVTVLLVSVMVIGCKTKDKVGDVEVHVKLQYSNEPLVMVENVVYPTGEPMQFSRVSFYMSDLRIGDEKLMDINYLNLTSSHSTLESAKSGLKLSFSDVPTGDYNQLSFSLGVPAEKNKKVPADFSSEDVLSNLAEYWPGWKSYIFARLEGQIQIDNESTGFSLHTGSDVALRSINLNKSISVQADKTTIVDIILDVDKVFGTSKIYDIHTNPQIHTPSQQTQVVELSDNYAQAFE